MRLPGFVSTQLLRAGVALLVLSVAGTGIADAAARKKKVSQKKPAAARVVDTRWQRGYADIVIDANTGRVLHEENADSLRHPASLTKVMTLYLLFEQLQAGRLRLDSQLPVSSLASRQSPTKLGLKAGSTISVEDALQGLITRSANDAAVVIAEAVAGDADTFAALMTRRARQLGMSRTTFKNPNGLPDPQQVTTARDLAVLGRAIQERFPRYYEYFSIRSFNYKGVAIRNHNRMFGRLEGVDGIKTGYTNASGFNLLTSVKRDGRYVIGVVLGGGSAASRDTRMAQLVTASFDRAYAGRQMVARMSSPPSGSGNVEEVAVAQASAPVPTPMAAPAPAVVPVPAGRPNLAMASVVDAPAADEVDEETAEEASQADPVTTGAVPPQRIAMVAPARPELAPARTAPLPPVAPPVGSAAPIVPTSVKTVAVAKPSAPVAGFANQPGILGTLSFTQASSTGQALPAAIAQGPKPAPAAKPVRLASADPAEIPRQIAETTSRATAAPRSGWAIQIGAFGSEADARAQLAKAKAKAGSALAKVDPYTESATKGSSTIVRARFAGFDEQAAAQKACKALKGQFGCMVFRN
ncbi:D-alanyl-D-alanine carboxypeptidase family protein [Ancylobacter oerskovii]|uniref:Serine hydrolase n=1 Tax=Ancylobacter oerskovii TaxID=459519 RepID=A0ABW4Z1L6_9HYPH|nr:D-alanyl-D-alanine carboxypeptidase family protein [Ancylobacter oerskovii]MBS7544996.1 SPOR domain-containing protein [Ancylobacter oerskovii]